MRLSDIATNMAPTTFTQIALLLFVGVFIGIVVFAFSRQNRAFFEYAKSLPLEDDADANPGADR